MSRGGRPTKKTDDVSNKLGTILNANSSKSPDNSVHNLAHSTVTFIKNERGEGVNGHTKEQAVDTELPEGA